MSFQKNFILVLMKKEGKIKYVSDEQVNEHLRNGWKKCKEVDLGGKE